MQLNLLGLGVIVIGTLMAVLFSIFLGVPIGEATGLLCGATTNTRLSVRHSRHSNSSDAQPTVRPSAAQSHIHSVSSA